MAVRIVTDSSADLPQDLARQWDITVVPCNVVLGDQTYKDGVDLFPSEFYRRLAASPRLPTTSQPSAADFQALYQQLLGQGHQVVSIHLSSKLSGTVSTAEQARKSLGSEAAMSVAVVDSRVTSLSLGLLSVAAAQQAGQSNSAPELATWVQALLPRCRCFFLLDTLEYLQKGGRIGKAQAFVGSLLNVKPILTIRDGEAHPVERLRNRQRAVARLVELAQELKPVSHLGVVYSTEPEQAEALRRALTGLQPEEQIVTSQFGATLGTYLGPRALGVALIQG
ncbi:MAG: DegV family protein [SAR202 cluster bacterium]|nr:DegV family protein [SAR202 cluster bacterium]